MTKPVPHYADLPIEPRSGARCAWGVFGADDQLGTVNWLTARTTLEATHHVVSGEFFSLNWETTQPDPPILGRRRLRHQVMDLAPIVHPGTDDYYDAYSPQGSSQWDSLSHIGHPQAGFYNGAGIEDVLGNGRNSISRLAAKGIVGRFVLADVGRYLRGRGTPLDHTSKQELGVDILEATLADQGSSLAQGDILLIRFGWIEWYQSTDVAEREVLGHGGYFPFPGLACCPEVAAWIWDHRLAAVAADNPALEAMPADVTSPDGFLHYQLIPLLGLTIGEMLVLGPLAERCAEDGRYTGLFTAAPLNTPGGAGSPANAVAIR